LPISGEVFSKYALRVTKRVKWLAMIQMAKGKTTENKRRGTMPKFYVESGRVRLVLDAGTAEQAAVRAFQWSSERQAEIYAEPPSELIRDAEASEFQFDDEITVNELGFSNAGGEIFDTWDIIAIWQGCSFTWY